ncbi:Zn-dependent hydrolase [Acetobacter pasteurianus]|uniref:N-carbamyl-L-amino acid amidohydrolase n=2 Tax=Acetobacter pasteurianus TaxID=438 RepID=C7JE91_ACEP3|nr:Zn-dependent hydrolase [Acetobacter pasteurianus]ASC06179.1 N-carbamoyl-L-amino-acid hydrolase [Acetobacter pasteurianus subsp. pasteurianus]BAI00275.1 N-carbamyl-L-amino acid amidohydrolase [Acetobacter pasteurianus IFO 3283-01]BAI03328.1 N-carbamyl-L-amino acid amidohydrolase [Acetobacter pasteurianus IFO 3283-03]BAI06373.1 N-carbamyl-L-amino acid amidohydrolase [Acetobacter pasteurianus IFO 3283-07]BAI09423.1 N-carbamyl-L-amino acid amidohydrolase [Acetobacter pasteurianus IFO 3283-22]
MSDLAKNSNLRIDGNALWADLMETAQFGGTNKGGVRRLTLTKEDKLVRDWFMQTCQSLGCEVSYDSMGNLFARRPGQDNDLPPITMGSHLDTQPTGGKFDGILGVLGGLAVLRTLHQSGYVTRHPIELINWTNEEGSRFSPPMMCSGVFAGIFTEAEVLEKRDRAGIRFCDELDAIGYRGEEICGQHPISAYFELHIEQGPILEAEDKTIGIVTGIQGARWYEVTVRGKDAHAGSTPMTLRHDALVATAGMIEAVSKVAKAHGPSAVGTVGLIENRPNSSNVVPGEVFFTVDIRDPDDTVVLRMEQELKALMEKIASDNKVTVDIVQIWDAPAVHFDPFCVDMVEQTTLEKGYTARRIVSGPGHDAGYLAHVAPTAMIFVPCKDGLSHNEEESILEEDAEKGANVLLGAVLKADVKFNSN